MAGIMDAIETWCSVEADPLQAGGLFVSSSSQVPLKHRAVDATVECGLGYADCHETLTYLSDAEAVSATFKFPLPPKAAVYKFEATIGDRRVVTCVKAKAEAEEEFTNAVQQGHAAVPMKQAEVGAIFTIELGNLPAMIKCIIRIAYLRILASVAGALEFVHTATYVPPYVSAASVARDPTGQQLKETDPTFAAVVTYSLSYSVRIVPDAQGIRSVECMAPGATISEDGGDHLVVLSEEVGDPSHDFTLPVELEPDSRAASRLSVQRCQGDGVEKTVLLATFVNPVAAPGASPPVLREVWLVVDGSGSMHGAPIAQAREAALFFVKDLPINAGVRFNLVVFGSSHTMLYKGEAKLYNADSEKQAVAWVKDHVDANKGGTQILSTLQAVYEVPIAAGYVREVVFLTDGGVSSHEEAGILALLKKGVHVTPLAMPAPAVTMSVFVLGIGHGVHRTFLDNMAETSGGVSQYVVDEEPIGSKCGYLRRCALADGAVLRPRLVSRLAVLRASPFVLPQRMFPGEPLHILAEVSAVEAGASLELQGELADGTPYQSAVLALDDAAPMAGQALAVLHAMSYIGTLLSGTSPLHVKADGKPLDTAPSPDVVKAAVVRLAVAENLVTPHTSAVGVQLQADPADASKVQHVEVPLQVPHGRTLFGTAGGGQDSGRGGSGGLHGAPVCRKSADVSSGSGPRYQPRYRSGRTLQSARRSGPCAPAPPRRQLSSAPQAAHRALEAGKAGGGERHKRQASASADSDEDVTAGEAMGNVQAQLLRCEQEGMFQGQGCDDDGDIGLESHTGDAQAQGSGDSKKKMQEKKQKIQPQEEEKERLAAAQNKGLAAAATVMTPAELLAWLNLLRQTDGSFPYSDTALGKLAGAAAATCASSGRGGGSVSVGAGGLAAAAPPALTNDQWMTVLVLAFLRRHVGDKRSVWEAMEAKALVWLAAAWPPAARSVGATTLTACRLL